MNTVQLRDAKARLSELVAAAERGQATTITKHGRPAAVIVPVEIAAPILSKAKPSFAELLLSIPHEIPIERDPSPVREVDFD
jgi:prevent-host-death family protein